ncbi:acyltransferase [Phocaeicola plebeius]|uniref:acyltransferase n=1 Tax=Phocaeicola plebeius TaxID=310297 RepID=UPI003F989A49
MVIKNIMKFLSEIIITFINLFYSYKIKIWFQKRFVQVYSIWISKQFPKIGNGVHFLNKITLRGPQYIYIKDKTSFGYGCILTAWDNYGTQKLSPRINIGEDSHFGEYNHITAINSITIGNGVLTGRWVTITDNAHGKSSYNDLCIKPHLRHLYSKGPIFIEDNVWIGDKVSILPNVRIGKSSIIAANSVVTKDIPPFSIAAGIPAKVIKSISTENIE